MAFANLSFPHPVLGIPDDMSGELVTDLTLTREVDSRDLVFSVNPPTITNSYINGLIDSGQARVIYKVYCSSTLTTWAFGEENSFSIHEDEVANSVDLQAFVVVSESISPYRHDSFHQMYHGIPFSLEPGEIIGITKNIKVPLPKENEQLGIGDIFKFIPLEGSTEPMRIDVAHPQIEIHYPVDQEGNHPPNWMFKQKPWVAYNIFVLPALEKAIREAQKNPNEVENMTWFVVLNELLPELENGEDPFILAQKVLEEQGIPAMKAYEQMLPK